MLSSGERVGIGVWLGIALLVAIALLIGEKKPSSQDRQRQLCAGVGAVAVKTIDGTMACVPGLEFY